MWKLMYDEAISQEDRDALADFIRNTSQLTQGPKVKEFEDNWSEWLGTKYSVFVNSGSSANLLVVQACKDLYGSYKWGCQACTWATNPAPIILSGQPIQFCDVDLNTLGISVDSFKEMVLEDNIKYLFATHILGFPAFNEEILNICNDCDITILEDCCEAHGSMYKNNKVGTIGKASTFSFYYGHHITTVEGGMISTNDEEFYNHLLLLRSHGMLRSISKESSRYIPVDGIDEKFTFLCSGYNVRNTELYAFLGMRQMKRLDVGTKQRNDNLRFYLKNLDENKYYANLPVDGVSLFAFPIICKQSQINNVKQKLHEAKIECRPLIAGNLFRHPMMAGLNIKKRDKFADFIHENALYVGNHEQIGEEQIEELVTLLNGC